MDHSKRHIWVSGVSEGRLGKGMHRFGELREPACHTGEPGNGLNVLCVFSVLCWPLPISPVATEPDLNLIPHPAMSELCDPRQVS